MENPFDTQAQKPSVVEEAGDLLSAAASLHNQARLAKKTKNATWLARLEGLARKLLNVLWDFTKKAFMLSVFNFIVDICNMILSSAMESLTKQKSSVGLPLAVTGQQQINDPFSKQYGNNVSATTLSW